jgi:ribonuclease-3
MYCAVLPQPEKRGCVITRHQLYDILGFQVKDPKNYEQAFIHKSALREFCLGQSYERLEFLGDSVLDFIVARYLYDKFPEANEGFLTRVRTKLVSGKCLCEFARHMRLQDLVIMNSKAIRQGWNHNDRILEDIFEALVACIYVDMGMCVARDFVIDTIENNVDWEDVMTDTNEKDILMRFTQAHKKSLPVYVPVSDTDTGSDSGNEEGFHIRVLVDNVEYGRGRARTKRQAEQLSARMANDRLGVPRPNLGEAR